MPAIPLAQQAIERSEVPTSTLQNMYFERAPTNLEDEVSIRPRARLALFGTAGSGPIRGLYRKGNVLANAGYSGQTICLSGADLYRVHQTTAVATLIDTGITGDLRMSAEGTEAVVVFACGEDAYETDGATVSAIAFPSGLNVAAVDYLAGYFLFASEFGRFYWSAIGGTTVSSFDYATAESQPDVLLTLKVIGDELWLFGRYSIEPWQPTGDVDLPFQRIGGRIFGIGVTGRETVRKLALQGIDKVIWVGTDRRVYITDPNPSRISDRYIEEILARIEDPTDLYATVDTFEADDFYVLQIPGEGSFAYHLQSGRWSTRTSYGRDLFRSNVSTLLPNNAALIGDDTTNELWEMTNTERTDDGDPVLFRFSGMLELPGASIRCDNVSIDLASGLNPDPDADPTIRLTTSDDMGSTWSNGVVAYIGRMGQRVRTAVWRRLGLMKRPGRLFMWETTEPVTIRKAKYNEPLR